MVMKFESEERVGQLTEVILQDRGDGADVVEPVPEAGSASRRSGVEMARDGLVLIRQVKGVVVASLEQRRDYSDLVRATRLPVDA